MSANRTPDPKSKGAALAAALVGIIAAGRHRDRSDDCDRADRTRRDRDRARDAVTTTTPRTLVR